MNKERHVIWLTGISGSGKTTLGRRLHAEFRRRGLPCELLDGDAVRAFFENDLGYTRADRMLNVRRIAFAAKLLADHGVTPIVANIAPYEEVREFIRSKLPRYVQIYLKASWETVRARDVKGHYRKFEEGALTDMVACDDAYDEPRAPDLVVHTDAQSVEQSSGLIVHFLESRGLFRG